MSVYTKCVPTCNMNDIHYISHLLTFIHQCIFHRQTRIVSVMGNMERPSSAAKQPIVNCCQGKLINIWPISVAKFYGLGVLKISPQQQISG